jgi:hypothetical protein
MVILGGVGFCKPLADFTVSLLIVEHSEDGWPN